MGTSALVREQPSTENVAPRPPGREHSSRMLGDGSPPSLTVRSLRETVGHSADHRHPDQPHAHLGWDGWRGVQQTWLWAAGGFGSRAV